MKQVVIALAVLGACTGEGSQIVIQIDGPMAAASVELVLAQSHVFIKRDQRVNAQPLDATQEPAFYVAQRRKLDLIFEEVQPVAGIEFQIVGADDLLPIAIARDDRQQIIGIGVLDPPQVFRDDDDNTENFPTRLEVIGDITRYPIVIEPVVSTGGFASAKPVSIGSGQVLEIRCNNDQAVSGIAWRPEPVDAGLHHQLRIALPLDGGDDAFGRLESEGFDLDCDTHTPSVSPRGFIPDGDQNDCDDTTAIVDGDPERREACDQIDTDCNANTMGSDLVAGGCLGCLGNRLTCYEGVPGEAQLETNGCTEASRCLACSPHTQTANGMFAGCESHGVIELPGECGDQCVIRVVGSDPRWEVKIGDADDPKFGITEGYTPTSDLLGIAVIPTNNPGLASGATSFGGFSLVYVPGPGGKVFLLEVALFASTANNHTLCTTPFEIIPPCGPAN